MTTFDSREKAFETRFVHDQDLVFRAEARRNRMVAMWVAELLGEAGAGRDAYAADILAVAMEGGTEAVIRRLVADLAGASPPVSEHQVRNHMDLEFAKASAQLKAE